jgi:5-(carboxyamino)imidazole ribonucleotide mutase
MTTKKAQRRGAGAETKKRDESARVSAPALNPEASHSSAPRVSVIMGSKSDWETMRGADEVLTEFDVAHECRVVSAHRTPRLMSEFASEAEARGVKVIIAGAGGAAHLPGMVAAQTLLPVLGVPVESRALKGLDSLLSIVQMPAGIPVGTLAIGQAGARNAALLAVAILANEDAALRERLRAFRLEQERQVRESTLS